MHFPDLAHLSFWRSQRLPVLLQTEAAECGLACLSMVASYWGHQTDISSMRRRFSVSLKGVTLKGLMAMAQGLALHTRPLKLDMQHLPELKLPAILHWDLNHFVVLKSVSGSHAVIHDPAVGERRLPLAEVAKHFTGVALELTPTAEFKKAEEKQQFSLLSLMGRVVGLKRGLLQLLVLGLALQVCALVAPFYMQWLVDEALLAADRDLITVLGCGFLLLVLVQTAIGAVRSWITTVLATNLNLQWLGNAFAHLLKLPLPYFEKRHTGDIVSRFNSIQTMQRSLTTQFVEGAIDGVLVLATLGMMLVYSPLLAGVACIAVLLYVLLRWALFKAMAVLDNRFSVGMLFAFISYKDQFSQRMASLVDKLFELRMLRLHGERVADIVLTDAEEDGSDVEVNMDDISPSIEIRNLTFRYAASEPNVLNGLNLSIPAGQCIAVTGPSGCGKTTLMKLLLGLLEPTEGEILIGGIQLGSLGLTNYRQLLGTVMQEDTLFAGSIADNISFFAPSPNYQQVQACAHLAAVHAEIAAMPMAFNTLVGDIGSGLSGGQKQRILLARALYKNPKLLVLDEATSHLDTRNEQAVNAAIRKIPLTRVIVAHRPETIAMAQRVVVLQQGEIVQDVMQETQAAA
jgi:ABC-type bacteriocin/lantibiotic exporter with double-glycine peptidase domain